MIHDLSKFVLPEGFRGRSPLVVQLWWLVQSTLFRWSPQLAYGFRVWLLRAFGASVGKHVLIRPSAKFTYPWKVTLGDWVWIGDDVVLYSLDEIVIESHAVISQKSYLCAGDHDYTSMDFRIRGAPIRVGAGAWIAADVFLAPGVRVGDGAVIGARSSVFSDMPRFTLCHGYPCKPVRARGLRLQQGDLN